MKSITFGTRKITKVNYSRTVSLPKLMLQNMDVDVDDYLEFYTDNSGSYFLKPVKSRAAE